MRVDPPPDESPETCPYCSRPFPDEETLALHEGLAHPAVLSDAERAAVREARAAEAEDLRTVQLLSLGALVLVYFGFIIVYAVFT